MSNQIKGNITQVSGKTSGLFEDRNVTMKSGHLVKDPEIISEGKFIKFRIASNKQYMSGDEVKTSTNYFNALVSSKLKEAFAVAQTLHKGDWVYVKGEDSTQSFHTAEGYKQTASTVFAHKVVLKRKADVLTPEV